MSKRNIEYKPEIFEEIFSDLRKGESIRSIFVRREMPFSRALFYDIVGKDEKLADQYARAREACIDTQIDDLHYIAQTEEDVQRARLMCDNIKWKACKMLPKKYGEKVSLEHAGKDGVPLTPMNIVIEGINAKSQDTTTGEA